MPSSRVALDDDIDDLLKELDMAGVGGGGSARTSTTAPEPTPAPCARVEATLASREPAPPAPPARDRRCRMPATIWTTSWRTSRTRWAAAAAAAAPAIIPPSFARVSDVTRTPKTTGGGGGAVKCSPAPMIASMATPPGGPASAFSEAVACDALRCVSCDFDVVSFDDAAWIDKVESAPEGRAKVTGSSPARAPITCSSAIGTQTTGSFARAWCAKSVRGRTAVSARGDGWIRGSGRRWPRWVGRCDGSVEDTEREWGAEEGGEPRCLLPVCQRNAHSASVKSHARDTAFRKSVPTGDKTRSLAQRLVTSWRWRWRREWTRCSAAETSTRSRVTSTRSSWRRALRRIGPGRRTSSPTWRWEIWTTRDCVPARAEDAKEEGSELDAALAVLQCAWQRDHAGVHAAAASGAWSCASRPWSATSPRDIAPTRSSSCPARTPPSPSRTSLRVSGSPKRRLRRLRRG